nr:hypothetical protein [Herbaspirillum sp. B39]
MAAFTDGLKTKLKAQLLDQSRRIMAGSDAPGLAENLKKNFPSLSQAMLINHVPEQGEDIYWILISLDEIAVFEIPRGDVEIMESLPEILQVGTYRSTRLRRDSRQRLDMALQLIGSSS